MPLIPDIRISVQNQEKLILDPVVKRGQFQRCKNGQLLLYAGGFTAVFPVIIDGEKWAFRCWHVPITDACKRLKHVSEFILQNMPLYLVPLQYTQQGILVNGEIFPTTRMKWIEGVNLKKFLCDNVKNKQVLLGVASSFLALVEDMHRFGIAHGDLQHGNILITENNQIYLVDYDSMYVPSMGNEYVDEIVGKEDYQHPNRKNNRVSNNKIDYFSELIIYISVLGLAEIPELADKYKLADTEYLLFSADDFKNLRASRIYRDLKASDVPILSCLLDILESYLSLTDINEISPFNEDPTFKKILSQYFKSDEERWLEAKDIDTIEAYQGYLKSFPHGQHCTAARYKINALIRAQQVKEEIGLWESAIKADSLEAYRHYLSNSVLKEYETEAQTRIEDKLWAVATSLNTEHSYRKYLNNTNTGKYRCQACKALENIFWKYASENHTVELYREYLSKSQTLKTEFLNSAIISPNDECKSYLELVAEKNRLAQKRLEHLDDVLWEKISTENVRIGYDFYIKQFPAGRHRPECDERIKTLVNIETEEKLWRKARQSHSLTGYRNYLKDSTLQTYAKEAEEKIAQYDREEWNNAKEVKTIDAINKYLAKFPNGIHVADAQILLKRLRTKKRIKATIRWTIVLAIIAAVVLRIIYVQTRLSQEQVSEIETKVSTIIEGAEFAKRNKDQINYSQLYEAEKMLNKIKDYSPNYNKYRRKIDSLK